MEFRAEAYRRQATFRQRSATISGHGRAPVDGRGRQFGYMLALGYEDENLYSTLRDGEAVRRFFDERAIAWWRHYRFEDVEMNCPTRNMASSQIACVNFVLPLGGTEDGLLAMLAAIDDDVTGIVPIEDPGAGTSSPVEFEWIGLGDAEAESPLHRGHARQAAGGAGGPEEGGCHCGAQRFGTPALVEAGRMAGRRRGRSGTRNRRRRATSAGIAVDWRDAVRITAWPSAA